MVSLLRGNIIDLPTSVSLNYYWCSGFMISSFLLVQVITGIILSCMYVANICLSFARVVGFNLDDFFMWLVRYFHIWGVTFIFFLFLVHMGRALYYSSYSKMGVWNVGFILYLLMMVEAFLGYILPWHQMSYWAATVLTSILNSVPLVGKWLFIYVVGGFSVTDVTLVRVFAVHVCLAFVILAVAVLHLFYLHKNGSNNPLFVSSGYSDVVFFHKYYTMKDGFVLAVCMLFCLLALLVFPDFVLDPESYIEANSLVTPLTIKPEWYFLAYYAMLRSVESKIGGLVLVLVFLFIFWLPTINSSSSYSLFRQVLFWLVVCLFFVLSYIGACHPEYPFIIISKFSSLMLVAFLFLYKVLWVVPYSIVGSGFKGLIKC